MPIEKYEIGFLPEPWDFEGEYFSLKPVEDHGSRKAELDEICIDGKIPLPAVWRASGIELKREPNSLHAGSMRQLPSSHMLTCHDVRANESKRETSAFVIHLLGVMAGTRLQFTDWRFDGSVPFEKPKSLPIFEEDYPIFVDKSIVYFQQMPTAKRRRTLINAMYFLGKAMSPQFAWERFLFQFMAFDALWKASGLEENDQDLPPGRSGMYMKRMNSISESYGLLFSKDDYLENSNKPEWLSTMDVFTMIRDTRNNLLHEAAWDTYDVKYPRLEDESSSSRNIAVLALDLSRISSRILLAMILGPNEYSSSDWALPGWGPQLRII